MTDLTSGPVIRLLTWRQRYRLRSFVASSLWIVPVLGMLLALGVAPLLRRLDEATGWSLFAFGPEGARAVLGGLVASVFTFVVFVFSILLVAVQIASANLSPRVIAEILAHRHVRVCLGLMVFTFVHGLAVLGRIEATVPQLPVAVVIASSLASIVAFLYLIDHLARWLRPVSVVSEVARDGARVIESIYPRAAEGVRGGAGQDRPRRSTLPSVRWCAAVAEASCWPWTSTGWWRTPARRTATSSSSRRSGDFVAKGDPLFECPGAADSWTKGDSANASSSGAERTIEQDPAFPFRIIVDIAAKALSPAINDPTTAVLALDQIHHLLRNLADRKLDSGLIYDRDQRLRLAYRTPDWEDFLDLAVTEIRHFGASSIQVARRLRAMLEDLIAVLPAVRRPALEAELRRLQRSAERAFVDPDDQARARQGDSQGLGGHH